MGMPTSCLVVAQWIAPRPFTHRVLVIPWVLRWSLVLINAGCCPLGEEVRSSPHGRGELLGFFREYIVNVDLTASHWARAADPPSLSPTAPSPVGPDGQADVAPL